VVIVEFFLSFLAVDGASRQGSLKVADDGIDGIQTTTSVQALYVIAQDGDDSVRAFGNSEAGDLLGESLGILDYGFWQSDHRDLRDRL